MWNFVIYCTLKLDIIHYRKPEVNHESKYNLWIDNHPTYSTLDLKEYPRHSINIKGFTPDIIGFNQFEDIIAIEAKGTKDIHKGIIHAHNSWKKIRLYLVA